jgi:hypothetical protein
MRAHYVIAAVAIILVGIGMTLPFSAAPIAEADSPSAKTVSVDVSPMHQNIENLPVQEFHDMTFVYSVGDNSVGE